MRDFVIRGGVFLFEDVPLETMTLVRYHDTEDGGHNGVWSDDPNYYDVMHISGMSKLDSNATLAWNINRNMTKWGDIPVGPAGINYGVIAPAEMASGNLYFDDEDHNNKNWAQVWLGPQNQYEPHGTYYGVQLVEIQDITYALIRIKPISQNWCDQLSNY